MFKFKNPALRKDNLSGAKAIYANLYTVYFNKHDGTT